MKSLLTLFFLSFSSFSIACEIDLPLKIILIKKNTKLKIKHSNCSKNVLTDISNAIHSSAGLTAAYELVPKHKIQFNKKYVEIYHLDHFLNRSLELEKDQKLTKIRSISNLTHMSFETSDITTFKCNNCDKLGSVNISMEVYNPINDSRKIHWFNSTLKIKTKVLTAKKDVRAFTKNSLITLFDENVVYTTSPSNYVKDKKKLIFYKTNKTIKKDQPLAFHDLTSVQIVKRGRQATVEIKNKTLRLETKAIARDNGKIGDIIELVNPKTKKTFLGKTVDFNRVEVEL